MNKPPLKLAFVDFWDNFQETDFGRFLAWFTTNFDVTIDEEAPDVVVYSCFGTKHLQYPDTLRIFFTGENHKPDFNICDYSFGNIRMDYRGKHLWVPFAAIMTAQTPAGLPPITPEDVQRKFCSFIYSQDTVGEGAILRKEFCEKLMREYAHVDCPGRVLHNLDAPELADRFDPANWNQSKRRFLVKYKFNIAFENSNAPGYITEKLTDAYLGNTVPIYWGSDGDTGFFPKESMICAHDYPTPEALIARIREANENNELYLALLAANPYRPENKATLPDFDRLIADFLKKAVEEHHLEHRETRTTNLATLHREFEQFKRHPYVRAAMSVYGAVQGIKRLFGLRKA